MQHSGETAAFVSSQLVILSYSAHSLIYNCQLCKYSTSKLSLVRKHMFVHRFFLCPHCKFFSRDCKELDSHKRSSHPRLWGRKFCKKCKTLFQKDLLKEHESKCGGDEEMQSCYFCDRSFKDASILKHHVHQCHSDEQMSETDPAKNEAKDDCFENYQLKIETNKTPISECESLSDGFLCKSCELSFGSEVLFANHLTIHDSEIPYFCNFTSCKKRFRSDKELNVHRVMEHELGPKKYICSYTGCLKEFQKFGYYKRHIILHSGLEQKVSCSWPNCGKIFIHEEFLKAHYLQHFKAKSYRCSKCFQSFGQKSGFKHHMEKVHDRETESHFQGESQSPKEAVKDDDENEKSNKCISIEEFAESVVLLNTISNDKSTITGCRKRKMMNETSYETVGNGSWEVQTKDDGVGTLKLKIQKVEEQKLLCINFVDLSKTCKKLEFQQVQQSTVGQQEDVLNKCQDDVQITAKNSSIPQSPTESLPEVDHTVLEEILGEQPNKDNDNLNAEVQLFDDGLISLDAACEKMDDDLCEELSKMIDAIENDGSLCLPTNSFLFDELGLESSTNGSSLPVFSDTLKDSTVQLSQEKVSNIATSEISQLPLRNHELLDSYRHQSCQDQCKDPSADEKFCCVNSHRASYAYSLSSDIKTQSAVYQGQVLPQYSHFSASDPGTWIVNNSSLWSHPSQETDQESHLIQGAPPFQSSSAATSNSVEMYRLAQKHSLKRRQWNDFTSNIHYLDRQKSLGYHYCSHSGNSRVFVAQDLSCSNYRNPLAIGHYLDKSSRFWNLNQDERSSIPSGVNSEINLDTVGMNVGQMTRDPYHLAHCMDRSNARSACQSYGWGTGSVNPGFLAGYHNLFQSQFGNTGPATGAVNNPCNQYYQNSKLLSSEVVDVDQWCNYSAYLASKWAKYSGNM